MKHQARFFAALSSEHRIKILRLLKEHPQCVNTLVQRLQLTQPAVSQHLRVLKEAGMVKAKKRGYWVHYEIDGDALKACGKGLEELFGGWVSLQAGAKGTSNCPPELLEECQHRKPITQART
jgi:DNA-binding transcriptional ArsR family regulator